MRGMRISRTLAETYRVKIDSIRTVSQTLGLHFGTSGYR